MQTDKMELFFNEIRDRLEYAEKKHPVFCSSLTKISGTPFYKNMAKEFKKANDESVKQIGENVIKEELYEMLEALEEKRPYDAYDEAVDLAVVAIRAMDFIFSKYMAVK